MGSGSFPMQKTFYADGRVSIPYGLEIVLDKIADVLANIIKRLIP